MGSENVNWGDTPFIPPSEIVLIKRVNEGAFGTVYKAIYMYQTVAVKVFRPQVYQGSLDSRQPGSGFGSTALIAQMEQEVRILRSLTHKNVVGFLGAVEDPPAIVMDYCKTGSLWDLLRRAETNVRVWRKLSWTRRVNLLLGAAQGMAFVHAKLGTKPEIIHRDLKSPNILLDDDWVAKVGDFGLSRFVTNELNSPWFMVATNPTWMAPEVMRDSDPPHEFTQSTDVFPMGIIMWELLTLKKPWSTEDGTIVIPGRIIACVVLSKLRPPIPADLRTLPGVRGRTEALDRYVKLMRACWTEDPQERPSYRSIVVELQHIKDLFKRRSSRCLDRAATNELLIRTLSLMQHPEGPPGHRMPMTESYIHDVMIGDSKSQTQEGASFLSLEAVTEAYDIHIRPAVEVGEEADDGAGNQDAPSSSQYLVPANLSSCRDTIPGFQSPFDNFPIRGSAVAAYPAGSDMMELSRSLDNTDSPLPSPSPFDNPSVQNRRWPPSGDIDTFAD